jgi:hypothetical protein
MYARLLKMPIKHDRIDEARRIFSEEVIPLCKEQKGYEGAYLLADEKSGLCCPITLWKSEEDMLLNEKNRFFQEQISKFLGLLEEPPFREEYKVIFKD